MLLGPQSLKRPATPHSFAFSSSRARGSRGFVRSVTIDHTQVPNTDQSSFPLLIQGTFSYLKTISNGGKVANASGYDIGFYADAACTTKLAWEVQSYSATTGAVIFWVRVLALSHSADTVIYMAYGSTFIHSDQSNSTGVWDTSSKAVLHGLNPGNTSAAPVRYAGNPILLHHGSGWEASQLEEPFIFIDPLDSTKLVMFYGGMAPPVATGKVTIGRATATIADPYTWTEYASNPVFGTGTAGQWDDVYVRPNAIINNGGGSWTLYYTGNHAGVNKIGRADSSDNGFTWTRYAGNPILTATGQGRNDGVSVNQGAVINWGGTLYMYYGYRTAGATLPGYNYATSADGGFTWVKNAGADVISQSVAGGADSSYHEFNSAVILDGTIYLTYEAYNGQYWAICMASATSPTGPFTKSPNNPVFAGSGVGGSFDQYHVATPIWFDHPTVGWILGYQGSHAQPYVTSNWDTGFASMTGTPADLYNATPPSVPDSTSLGNNGLVFGLASVAGAIGAGVGFNGASAHVAFPQLTDLSYSSGSIEWWMDPALAFNDGAFHGVWGMGETSGNFLDGQKDNGNNLKFGWNLSGNDERISLAASNANYPQNTFSSYAYTWGGGTGVLYMDGVQIGTHAVASVANIGKPFYIGWQNGGLTAFKGSMDEFRISNTKRSADWIATRYANEKPASTLCSVGPETAR